MNRYGVPWISAPVGTFTPVALRSCFAPRLSTLSVGVAPDVVCGTIVTIALSILASEANARLLVSVYAVDDPPVVIPPRSSRHSAIRAIMARALSLTADGAIPSAQFTLESAVALVPAVFDQSC